MAEEIKKRIKIYAIDEVTEIGKTTTEVVGPSVVIGGMRKCEHGGFIPVTASHPDRAPYCSLCYPYEIKLKE